MPLRRRLAKRRPAVRRRPAARRRYGLTVPRTLQPIPPKFICKMKYSETVFTDAAGQYVFNLNSIHDPNRTGFGHQPYGFDNLALLYNRYRVISCGWRIGIPTTEGSLPCMFACIPSNDDAIVWDINELRENPRAKYAIQNPGASLVFITGKSYLPKLMGQTKAQYMANENTAALVTGSPNENAELYIKTTNQDVSVRVGQNVQVLLEYTVEFFDQKRILQS
jgi:hypothetical protein